MGKKPRVSLRDIEQETSKFLAPATDKEKAIVDAAVALMGERGVVGATTAEIAKRAGVTERTLFRYFPSKADLIKRVLFPMVLGGGLSREWAAYEALLNSKGTDFKDWYVQFTSERNAARARDPAMFRTMLIEVMQNAEFRDSVSKVWREHIWEPMVEGLRRLQQDGAIRGDVDVEMLARVIHSVNFGYFIARHIFAPGHPWDDASEIDKMGDLLSSGGTTQPAGGRKKRG